VDISAVAYAAREWVQQSSLMSIGSVKTATWDKDSSKRTEEDGGKVSLYS